MNDNKFFMTMRFNEDSVPDLLDISSLLYDFELSHDYGLILSEKEYREYRFSQYFWYRYGRPVQAHHRVKAVRIIKESLFEITVIITSLGALWILIQIIDKIVNWPLNREKLKLEVEKLKLDTKEKMPVNVSPMRGNNVNHVKEPKSWRWGL